MSASFRIAINGIDFSDAVASGELTLTRDTTPPQRSHGFIQDPAEAPARLCQTCGMWPEHHNHGRGACVCADCMPEERDMPLGESSWVAPPVHRGPRPDDWEDPHGQR